jgi:Zn-dependent M28 family amino/carboxypeptidase
MVKLRKWPWAMLGLILLLLAAPQGGSARQNGNGLSPPEAFKAEFQAVPCKNKERLSAVKALFEKMGAAASEIEVDKHKHVENLVIRKPGASEEKIVIGAHYDKVADGCGALDNWTGVVVLAHLYQTLKNVPLKKTVIFAAFGREEEGLIGSQAMAKAIGKEQAAQYCAMINIDSLGLAAPQVAANLSSEKLGALAEELAKVMNMPFARARLEGGSSDSVSFIEKKIPAVTIHGMSNDWPRILHSSSDRPSKVNSESVYLGYRLALAMVQRVDEAACNAYRR